MTDDDRGMHPEVVSNLSYFGVLVPELTDAGRWDLAAQVRDERNLTPAKLEAIVNVGLELRLEIALPIAKRQRAVRMLLEAQDPRLDEKDVNDLLQLVDTHWDVLREKRLHRRPEVGGRDVDSSPSKLALEEDSRWIPITARLDEFDDLFELHFEAFLGEHEEELKESSEEQLGMIISDLPSGLRAVFDRQYRNPLLKEFRLEYGDDWATLLDRNPDLRRLWQVRFELRTRAFLMEVYRGPMPSAGIESAGDSTLSEGDLNWRVGAHLISLGADLIRAGENEMGLSLIKGEAAEECTKDHLPSDLEGITSIGMHLGFPLAFQVEKARLLIEFIRYETQLPPTEHYARKIDELLVIHRRYIVPKPEATTKKCVSLGRNSMSVSH